MIPIFPLLIVSNFLSFFAIAGIVEILLFTLRIKNFRVRAICRLIPVLKLPFDFFLFIFTGRNLFKNLNPFLCNNYFSKLISKYVPIISLEFFLVSIIVISAGLALLKVIQFYKSTKALSTICSAGTHCSHQIVSKSLEKKLRELNVTIIQTDEVNLPCAFGFRHIIMPRNLVATLSTEEYEAVLAHELEHLRKFDPFIKIVSKLISKLFWWVPMGWWLKKIEEEQEHACDKSVKNYEVNNYTLANAVYKVLCFDKERHQEIVLNFTSKKQSSLHRIQKILEDTYMTCESNTRLFIATGSCLCTSVAFGVWIC